jgi:hypothetical protein
MILVGGLAVQETEERSIGANIIDRISKITVFEDRLIGH